MQYIYVYTIHIVRVSKLKPPTSERLNFMA